MHPLPASLICMPHRELVFIHPHFLALHLFLTVKPLLPLHHKFPAEDTRLVQALWAGAASAHRLLVNRVSVGKTSWCIQARSILFLYVPLYSFRLGLPTLHFTLSTFTLAFYCQMSPHPLHLPRPGARCGAIRVGCSPSLSSPRGSVAGRIAFTLVFLALTLFLSFM